MRDIFVQPSGQDDNLGDSALRAGLLRALASPDSRLHVHLDGQSSDYLAGLPLGGNAEFYPARAPWLKRAGEMQRPIFVVNAGEINPQPDRGYPHPRRTAELRSVSRRGLIIASGIGLKDPEVAARVNFSSELQNASVMSWRDRGSRNAAGFGDVAPDWAFSLGTAPDDWAPAEARTVLAVTLRFDRPWPSDDWLSAVKRLAERTSTQIVTIAQVARDSPRAVRLASALGGTYSVALSTRHDDMDAHVRSVYSQSIAVVSDRAHALIMGATEGAFPVGSGSDPQKIKRLLDTVGLGTLTGSHEEFTDLADDLVVDSSQLRSAVISARGELNHLTNRIREAIDAV